MAKGDLDKAMARVKARDAAKAKKKRKPESISSQIDTLNSVTAPCWGFLIGMFKGLKGAVNKD